jgi:hypothetical protein
MGAGQDKTLVMGLGRIIHLLIIAFETTVLPIFNVYCLLECVYYGYTVHR